MFDRSIAHHYEDPIDMIWIQAARDLGIEIVRSPDAFATYDGKGTLTIAEASYFDADDCLAQMIFHELCHWLVAGRRGLHLADWGLSNLDDRDLTLEYATHRVQAALSTPYGLRDFMAVTTDWRPYWDALPPDPLKDGDDPAIAIAQSAAHLARLSPFDSVLTRALQATATIADVVRNVSDGSSLWNVTHARHRLGSLLADSEGLQCGMCAWAVPKAVPRELDASATPSLSCRQHNLDENNLPTVSPTEQACERWEKRFTLADCGSCGACCRQGFDLLTVSAEDPFINLHPELIQLRDSGEFCVPRPNGVCIALHGDGDDTHPYRCGHYDTRPRNCSDFEVAGTACLLARRRVGLSR
ncbi:hypothetical protein N9X53_02405 [Mariniblastus sp.]|nr:hypothetical protein [Mariniblastus sp.]MDB4370986.1 hypothetical protein [Mariniblastus sp.]|eukprot:COSAG01_NODE_97_length_26660_cov_100.642935_17_plen_357_part_00